MSYETHRQNLYTYVKANFSGAPVVYDNVGGNDESMPYVIMTILDGDTITHNSSNRFVGEVVFQVITAHNGGEQPARQLADTLFALFHDKYINNGYYGPARLGRIGHAEGVYQLNMSVSYKYDA